MNSPKNESRNTIGRFIQKLEKMKQLGVDITKIQNVDTIQTLAEKSGIEKEKLEEIGLNPNDKIGQKRSIISQAYRGKGESTPPTEEEIQRILGLGVNLEKRNATQEFIEKLEKLKEIGVDITKIKKVDTIQTLAEKSGVKKEKIEEIGLNPNDKIGASKNSISRTYRGKGTNTMPTEAQVRRLLELGIGIGERNITEEFIEKLEKLNKIGIDITKLRKADTIKILAEKSGITKEKIEEIGLKAGDKIGQSKSVISQAYRGKGNVIPPTKEQVQRLLELGISLEKIERNVTQEFIEKIEKLRDIGVDVTKIAALDTIQVLAEKSGVEQEKLEEIGLNPKDKIGQSRVYISQAYREKRKMIPPTKEQVQRLLELGISLEKIERNVIQEFIGKLEKLKEIGVDVTKIKRKDTIQILVERSGINREKIEEIGLNASDKIGSSRNTIIQAYRGNVRNSPPTKEQVQRLLELGISLETKRRTGKEIAEASISSLKNIEMADGEDFALKELVERTKEGGIKINE